MRTQSLFGDKRGCRSGIHAIEGSFLIEFLFRLGRKQCGLLNFPLPLVLKQCSGKCVTNESLVNPFLHVSSKRFDQMVAELTVRLQMTARDDIVQTEFGSTK